MSNLSDYDRILKTECNFLHFTRNCRIKNLDDLDNFERDEIHTYLWRQRRRNDYMLHYEQVFGNVFERREIKCFGVFIKHCRKVKGEQVITLQMAKNQKPKNSKQQKYRCYTRTTILPSV